MSNRWGFKIRDESDKTSSSGFYLSDLAVDQDGNIIFTDVSDMESMLADLTLGNIVASTITLKRPTGADTAPTDVAAQNEWYINVPYQDTVTLKKYTSTIPSPDPALRKANTDDVDYTNQRWIDAVATIEAASVSELGNPIVVLKGAKFNGRAQRSK